MYTSCLSRLRGIPKTKSLLQMHTLIVTPHLSLTPPLSPILPQNPKRTPNRIVSEPEEVETEEEEDIILAPKVGELLSSREFYTPCRFLRKKIKGTLSFTHGVSFKGRYVV